MKISVVIPNFNGCNLLKNNLPKVIASVKDSEVIVVDDASTDDSLNLLKTNFAIVKVIVQNKNEGFASTVNRGVKEASGEFVVLLNSDVIPDSNFLTYLTAPFSDSKVFAVGCLQKSNNGGKIKKEGRGVGRFEKGFLMHGSGTLDKTTTLWVFGGAGMFRKEVWEKLGGMNELYNPFYWEDIDLSYRALKAGFKLVFESKSVVMHNQEKGAIRNMYTPGQVKTIAYRNQIFFVWMNITDFQFILNHIIWFPYHLFKSLVTGDLLFAKAFLMAILKIPYILGRRYQNKKNAIISDRKILAKIMV